MTKMNVYKTYTLTGIIKIYFFFIILTKKIFYLYQLTKKIFYLYQLIFIFFSKSFNN